MRTAVWAWVRIVGGVAILSLLIWRLGTGAFLDGLRVIDAPTLLAAFTIGVATTVLSAWRWCLVARRLGIHLPLRDAVGDYYRALFLNAALPGGILGDVHRAVRHGRDVGDVGRGVRAVVLERAAGQVVLVSVGVTVLLTYPSPLRDHLDPVLIAQAGTLVAVLAVTVAILARRRLHAVYGDLRILAAPRTLLTSALVLTGHLATFLLAARTAGSTAPVVQLLPLLVLALLAMILPVNIGGWGPREGVTAWAFGAAGLSAGQGLTVAVVYGVFAFVAALPGAAVLLARWAAAHRPVRFPALPLAATEPAGQLPAAPPVVTAPPGALRHTGVLGTISRPVSAAGATAQNAAAHRAGVEPAVTRHVVGRNARVRAWRVTRPHVEPLAIAEQAAVARS